ncbi:Glycosyl transferases group 1 [anaerobic digester metagenome]
MRDKGFVSNRLFDGFAAGAFIISDRVEGAESVFGDALVTYQTPEELHELIDHYSSKDNERSRKAETGQSKIMNECTFQKRAESILDVLNRNL